MCGRYATTRSAADLAALFDAADEAAGGLAADYNVAPTDAVPVVRRSRRAGRVLSVARWGLVPSWAPDRSGASRMINARVETVAGARAYAASFRQRRALLPADGWYEWRRLPTGRKQPYFLTSRTGDVLAFAGIWSSWGAGPHRVLTASILTAPAVGELAAVHDRMPVLLPPWQWSDWLAEGDPPPIEADTGYLAGLEIRPVGPRVGDVRSDGPDLIEPVVADPVAAPPLDCVDLTLF